MSDKPSACSTPGYAEALAKIDKALQHVFAICKGDERWTMRIPARPDTDSDLIICDALETARKLLAVPSETAARQDIPEGRGSIPAGALEIGSPLRAARGSNPEGAASGGVSARCDDKKGDECSDAKERDEGCFRAVRAERLQREAAAKLDLREKQLLECQHQLITRNDELALAMRSAVGASKDEHGRETCNNCGAPEECFRRTPQSATARISTELRRSTDNYYGGLARERGESYALMVACDEIDKLKATPSDDELNGFLLNLDVDCNKVPGSLDLDAARSMLLEFLRRSADSRTPTDG